MAERKETGKALDYVLNRFRCKLVSQAYAEMAGPVDATVDHIVAALLANPEARMAVLERMPEYTKLREAAHSAACAWSRDGDGDKAIVGKRMNALYLLTSKRDQSLSATTTESCPRCDEPLPTACDSEMCPMSAPSPMGEGAVTA